MRDFFGKRNIFSSLVSIVLSVAFVASVTFAASTISTNIQTDGTLSVTGVATMNGQLQASSTALFGAAVTAYSTFNVTGLTTLGFASTTALSLNGVTSNLMVNGYATTTASNGNLDTLGNIGINGLATTTASTGNFGTLGKIGVGTTSPTTLELSAQGTATTTVAAFSTVKGGCLQLSATNGTLYRMYIAPSDTSTTSGANAGRPSTTIIALWEVGSCK